MADLIHRTEWFLQFIDVDGRRLWGLPMEIPAHFFLGFLLMLLFGLRLTPRKAFGGVVVLALLKESLDLGVILFYEWPRSVHWWNSVLDIGVTLIGSLVGGYLWARCHNLSGKKPTKNQGSKSQL